MKKLFKYYLPPLVWAGIIFLFSSLPTAKTSDIYWQDFIVKKLAHVIEYGMFSLFLYRSFVNSGVSPKNAGLYSILISLVYGATDEIHQSFTPGREPRVRDVVFDTIGAILAIHFIWNLLPKAPKRLKTWAKRLEIT